MIDPSLPLIDLHRHLEGSVSLETVLELGRQYNLALPAGNVEGLRPFIQVTSPQPGVMAFIERFETIRRLLVDETACIRIAQAAVLGAAQEGLDYLELRFSPWYMAELYGLDPAGVVAAVCEGVAAGQRQAQAENRFIQVNLIGILSRTYGPEVAWKELEALLTQPGQVVALDLAGDEANWPGGLFVEHFRRARQAGWQVTVHAGEACGPDSIWQAVAELGANRIGHAARAGEDPALLAYLRDHAVGIEANLTSNVQTSTVSGYDSHPLRRFLELGLLATINSDDPAISGINLPYEYQVAAPAAGLSAQQIRQAQQNALNIAFLSESEKETLRRRKA